MYCRNCDNPLDDRAVACPKCGLHPYVGTAYCQACGKPTSPEQVVCRECQATLARPVAASNVRAHNKVAAGVCGILLGALGVHKFILGYTGAGIIMLLVSVVSCGFAAGIVGLVGLVEGIIYLTKSDEEFVKVYVENRREWF